MGTRKQHEADGARGARGALTASARDHDGDDDAGLGLASLLLAVVLLYGVVPPAWLAPLHRLTTFFHEAGHSLASIVTGGEAYHLVVAPGGGGWAMTGGGRQWVVLAAGYVGTAATGALLLWLNSFKPLRRWILLATGVFVLAMTVRYASGWFTWVCGLAMGGGFLVAGRYLWPEVQVHVVTFLGLYVGLAALDSLAYVAKGELGLAEVGLPAGLGHNRNDAQLMQDLTGVPALLWAALWLVVSAAVLWLGLRRLLRAR